MDITLTLTFEDISTVQRGLAAIGAEDVSRKIAAQEMEQANAMSHVASIVSTPNDDPYTLYGVKHPLARLEAICVWKDDEWQPQFARDAEGHIWPLPHCFSLNEQAIEALDAVRNLYPKDRL